MKEYIKYNSVYTKFKFWQKKAVSVLHAWTVHLKKSKVITVKVRVVAAHRGRKGFGVGERHPEFLGFQQRSLLSLAWMVVGLVFVHWTYVLPVLFMCAILHDKSYFKIKIV